MEPTSPRSTPSTLEDFTFVNEIGQGSYSTIFQVIFKPTGRQFALKILSQDQLVRSNKQDIAFREKNVLLYCKEHGIPNIITLHYTFKDKASLYFLLDFCENGSLQDFLEQRYSQIPPENIFDSNDTTAIDEVDWNSKYNWAKQALKILTDLHSHNIMHGDFKSENLLLDDSMNLILGDFGTSYKLNGPSDSVFTNETGSLAFISPEWLRTKSVGLPSDVWAFGCFIYRLFSNQLPFDSDGSAYQIWGILMQDQLVAPTISQFNITQPSQHTLTSSNEIFNHLNDVLAGIFKLNPKERPTMKALEEHPFFNL